LSTSVTQSQHGSEFQKYKLLAGSHESKVTVLCSSLHCAETGMNSSQSTGSVVVDQFT